MKKKYYIIASLALLIIAYIIFSPSKKNESKQLMATVEKGKFEIIVTITGELQAKSSVDIKGPSELRNSRNIRVSKIKIKDLVAEGTVVDSGEYVGALDQSEVGTSLKDLEDGLETANSKYTKNQIDTAMQMRELRNGLVNLKFELEEAQIVLDQSKFEPPSKVRQAKISLAKQQRSYKQALDNYKLKVQQAKASMLEAGIALQKAQRKVQEVKSVMKKFDIYAPQSGMVIYKKEWGGEKRKVGSSIDPWDLTIATLPDLSSMNSKTYVNEIDISKVKVGQEVRLGIDAFPKKKYTGRVLEIANIGEQLKNTDAKVFEVIIEVNESDKIMRPAMTTSNQIITQTYSDVLYLPLEAISNEDSLSYVYTKSNKKQIIVPGAANENYIIVEKGLDEGDEVFLSVPENTERFKLSGAELIPIIKERQRKQATENGGIVKETSKKKSKIKS
ncbi:MAG: efflux RND transporter periplasmic adaptor subunit [Bacteroidales bacterium]|nr:efflux RND transporter periplasmic adaptor subunit [Bacteroidales bacterium]